MPPRAAKAKAKAPASEPGAKRARVDREEDAPAPPPARASRRNGNLSEDALADAAGSEPRADPALQKAMNVSFWSQWATALLWAWVAEFKKVKIPRGRETDREWLISTLSLSAWAARPKEGVELSELRKCWRRMVGDEEADATDPADVPARFITEPADASAASSSAAAASGAQPQVGAGLAGAAAPPPLQLSASEKASIKTPARASAADFFAARHQHSLMDEETGDRDDSPKPAPKRAAGHFLECMHCCSMVATERDTFLCPGCRIRGDLPASHPTNVHLSAMARAAPPPPASKEPAAAAASSHAGSGQSLSTALSVSAPKLLDKELQTMLDEHPSNPYFGAECSNELAITENRKALGATAAQRPSTKVLEVIRAGKLINMAYALPIAIGSAAALEGKMGLDASGNVTVVASKALAKVTTLEQFSLAFFATIGPALINQPMALAQWFALGRTALKIAADNGGNFAPAATYMEQLLSERVLTEEDFARVSNEILQTIRGAAFARPMQQHQQQGAGGPSQSRGRDSRQGGAHPDKGACYNWNKGVGCTFTPCRFAHVCEHCKGSHKGSACPGGAAPTRGPIPPRAPSVKTAASGSKGKKSGDDGHVSE